jgi:hypothetical protein
MPSSLPNLLYELVQPEEDANADEPAQEDANADEPVSQPLRRLTRIKKPSRAMLEHLASHCTTLDPAATALYACDNNDVILSIFAAT